MSYALCVCLVIAVAIGPATGRSFPWLLVRQLVTCKAQIAAPYEEGVLPRVWSMSVLGRVYIFGYWTVRMTV